MNAFDYFFEKTYDSEKIFLEGKENISFRELYRSCLSVAAFLKSKYGQNKPVFLISANNVFFIKSYLAILKSGNICVPLDPKIEKENYNFIAALTNPVAVFLTPDIEKNLPAGSAEMIFPETLKKYEIQEVPHAGNEKYDPENCAEIIFTSGSTGKPKGVMISHRNLIANTSSILDYLGLDMNDRILVVLPFYYCYGLSLLHTHLRAGGSIILNNSFIFLGTVINNLIEYKCTGFAGVPSHFQILLRKSETFKKTSFPDLKYVTQAGGKLATVFIDEFRESFPGVSFFVMYGQTEGTARLSYLPPELYESKKGSVGKGIPGVELRVVNEKNEEIEPGETGEIIAKGDNIMQGYFSDAADTEKTIRNGWLYTGDIGTVDKDGYIYLTARKKEIIKMSGKRISPKEIETVLLEVPEVVDCTVEGVYDDLFGEAIKATVIIVPGKNKEEILEKIKKHCSKNLALHKIPQIFDLSEKLEISATGKKIKNSGIFQPGKS